MSCPTETFTMSPEEFSAARTKLLSDQGIEIPEGVNHGTISKLGATVQYDYDGETLTLTVISKPFLISCGAARNMMRKFFVA